MNEGGSVEANAAGAIRTDEWAVGGREPEAVHFPRTEDEVVEVLRAAAAGSYGVVPLGAGTDRGCEPPDGPFVVLSTSHMDAVERYEAADLTITARAGLSLGRVSRGLAEHGQWLPFDPPRAGARSLGGLVAGDARGPLASLYGAVRDHVLGLTTVTGDGRVLRLGGRVMKNVAGFDLVRLMVGSRGTLGVLTSVTLRVFPRPEEDHVLLVRRQRPEDLWSLAEQVFGARVVPASAVVVTGGDEPAMLAVRLHGAKAAVAVEERWVLADALDEAERVRGEAAGAWAGSLADHASDGALVLRVTVPPALIPRVFQAAERALPGVEAAADLLGGRVRLAVAERAHGRVDADAVRGLRTEVEGLGGALALDVASPELVRTVGAFGGVGGGGAVGDLSASLKRHFDPGAVLSPGRFVS